MFESHKVTKDVQVQRLNVCAICEHNKVGVCAKCGCIVKLKTQWKGAYCPIRKWESVK